MTSLELLAPAKNLECGIAAIDHGADAVYIGASRFGARAAAGNGVDDIRKLCDYARPYGVKVYVTVNTILYDDELDATRLLLKELANAGVDAVLVQDMAILQLAEEVLPLGMVLHASTQTDNRSAGKVRWLRDRGFSRVVLARELSVQEIAEIHREVPDVELEVFVHGALCVSYSGQCYASQHCFGRSANRGECAQFCRMPFSLIDADGKVLERERYLLSLKDMNQSSNLLRLAEAGATSFKIEGRLKDAAYVKNVTAAYSERLNEIVRRHPDKYRRASLGRCEYLFTPDLERTFNRGYTDYFADGRKTGIVSFDTPKAIGTYVGMVKEMRRDSFNVAGTARFSNGDGLCFLNAGHQFEGFRANRVEGNRIYPFKMPKGLRPGMALYRNNDQEFERVLSKPSARRRIPISLSLSVTDGGFALSARLYDSEISAHDGKALLHDNEISVCIEAEHQPALKSPRENLIRQLTKLGDSHYECKVVSIPDDFAYFIPNSQLSELRHQLMERLDVLADSSKYANSEDKQSTAIQSNTTAPQKDTKGGFHYAHPYLYNISNKLSQAFYHATTKSAYELQGGDGPIMQCRYCIKYSLGFCVHRGGKKPDWREPLSLRLADGRCFPLEFDCKNCQMNVYGSAHNSPINADNPLKPHDKI